MLSHESGKDFIWFNGDDPSDSALLSGSSGERLKGLIGSKDLVIIDEAQEINDIGRTLKLITDLMPDIELIVSGSSAFELANKLNEPMTGRKLELFLYPLSFSELVQHHGLKQEIQQLDSRLLYGSYPEIASCPGEERDLLLELTSSYLYKDIFKFGNIRKPKELEKILKLLAWQVGSEVNISEVAGEAGCSSHTVEHYIDLLQKAYIVFPLPAFARNLRNEIKKNKKIYFFDNGIRNAIIGNFSLLENRNDVGALWENYLVSERQKMNSNRSFYGSSYFWRTQQQQEIDYIEDIDGQLSAYEFKWNPKKKIRLPITFTRNYPLSHSAVINRDNYDSFLT